MACVSLSVGLCVQSLPNRRGLDRQPRDDTKEHPIQHSQEVGGADTLAEPR